MPGEKLVKPRGRVIGDRLAKFGQFAAAARARLRRRITTRSRGRYAGSERMHCGTAGQCGGGPFFASGAGGHFVFDGRLFLSFFRSSPLYRRIYARHGDRRPSRTFGGGAGGCSAISSPVTSASIKSSVTYSVCVVPPSMKFSRIPSARGLKLIPCARNASATSARVHTRSRSGVVVMAISLPASHTRSQVTPYQVAAGASVP